MILNFEVLNLITVVIFLVVKSHVPDMAYDG